MSVWLAALIAGGALVATYLFCVRPMLGGRGHCVMPGDAGRDAELDRQVAELREEVRVLRAQDSLDRGRVPGTRPTPPTDA